VPWLLRGILALLVDNVDNNDPLCGGEEDDGEGGTVLDSVEEWSPALVRREVVLDEALAEPNEIREAACHE
jgi:hypothetical protein